MLCLTWLTSIMNVDHYTSFYENIHSCVLGLCYKESTSTPSCLPHILALVGLCNGQINIASTPYSHKIFSRLYLRARVPLHRVRCNGRHNTACCNLEHSLFEGFASLYAKFRILLHTLVWGTWARSAYSSFENLWYSLRILLKIAATRF